MTRRQGIAVVVIALAALTACSSDGSGDGDVAAFCSRFHQLSKLVVAASVPPEEMQDVGSARSLADDIARTARELPRVAPDEIRDDVEDLSGTTAELAAGLRDFYQGIVDDPARANDPTYLSSFEPVTEDRRAVLQEAGERVRPYVDQHCGEPLPPAEPSETTDASSTDSNP